MTTALEGDECSAARPSRTLPPGKSWYPLYRRLGGPQGRSGQVENLAPPGFDPRTVQSVVSRYTDWATLPIFWCVCVCVYIYIYICCAFVGLDNKLFKMHGTYIKISQYEVHTILTAISLSQLNIFQLNITSISSKSTACMTWNFYTALLVEYDKVQISN